MPDEGQTAKKLAETAKKERKGRTMKCKHCGDKIRITRNKLAPIWDVECSCTSIAHAHLEYALERHQWKAGHPDEPVQCRGGAALADGTLVEYPPGVEPPECGLKNGEQA